MMEGFHHWRLRLVAVCFFFSIRLASSEKDFVNIACCADSTYTDPQTKLNYTSDFSWFSDRTSCRRTTLVNSTGYDKTRVFDIVQGKRCYNFPAVKNQEYLLRGIFGSDEFGTSFDVSIGVSLLSVANSLEDLKIEGVFRATKSYIDFCLFTKRDKPYISLIELRPLKNAEFLNGLGSSVLKVIRRVNLGSTGEDIRYPDDQSDRIWESKSSLAFSSYSSEAVNISDYSDGANVTTLRPPPQVLVTAATHPERLQFIYKELDAGNYEYRVLLYYMELNNTVRLGQRVFDIYVNNQIEVNSFDILANGSRYKQVYFNVTANGLLNLTMIKTSGSQLGPICSAYEMFQVRPGTQETNQADSEAMLDVRNELLEQNRENALLDSWSGDPCALYPWEGLECDMSTGSFVITELGLSSYNLEGPLPSSVTKLSNLKILNLSHNEFNGDIPSFPTSSVLLSVDVSYNDLDGILPDSFAYLPNLKSLYFGCNSNLSKHVPSNFSSSILTDCGRCASKRMQQTVIVIVIATCGSLLIAFAIGIIVSCLYRRKVVAEKRFGGKGHLMESSMIFSFPSKDDFIISSVSIQPFTLDYIEVATEKYKTLVGEGGFGSVYRGILNDGQEVAVKVRSATSTQGTREFENELNLLSAIRHENLVPLLGYCCENEQQILVYPFMSNGSLQDRLYGEAAKRKVLDWPTRLSVALGAARGLTYLHTFAVRSIIHRDVKSSNILLDHSMCAKVADFGFSKYAPQEGDSGASLEVRGTAGYLDPEYYTTQHLSAKSDVFSFGVVLLEIVSGREPLDIHRPRNEWSLVEWAKPYLRESKIDEIVDPGIKGGYHAEAMWRVVEVALACIEPFSAYRPCMADIVRELEDALIIENNASEYMKSIDSLGGSNRYSIVLEKRIFSQPPPTTETSTSTSTTETQSSPAPKPR